MIKGEVFKKKEIIMKEKQLKVTKFIKGKHCYRCGMSKEDVKKSKAECGLYGTYYGRHLFKTK